MPETVFDDGHYRVVTRESTATPRMAILFSDAAGSMSLALPAFAEDVFERAGLGYIAVRSARNDGDAGDLAPVIDAVRRRLDGRVAIGFAAGSGACALLALAPALQLQHVVLFDPARPEGEPRVPAGYTRGPRGIWLAPDPWAGGNAAPAASLTCVFDPFARGEARVLPAQPRPPGADIRIAFAGDDVAGFLRQAGLLDTFLLEQFHGTACDRARFLRDCRTGKRRAAAYWAALALALARRKRFAPAQAAARQARALPGGNTWAIASRAAETLRLQGDPVGAIGLGQRWLASERHHDAAETLLRRCFRDKGWQNLVRALDGEVPGADMNEVGVNSEEDAAAGPTVIHDDGHYRVLAHDAEDNERVAVLFSTWRPVASLDTPGFGEEFLEANGISFVSIRTANNDWYQGPVHDALAVVRRLIGQRDAVAYASSMGAYAAINFAHAIGTRRTLAFGPQFSVDPAKVAFEKRWKNEVAALRFPHDNIADIAPVPGLTVVYDPFSSDNKHLRLIRRRHAAREIRVPFSGHDSARLLHTLGLFGDYSLDFIRDEPFDPEAFAAIIRQRKRESPVYWSTLSEHFFRRRRRDLALDAALRAARLPGGEGYGIQSHAANMYLQNGRPEDAVGIYQEWMMNAWFHVPARKQMSTCFARLQWEGLLPLLA